MTNALQPVKSYPTYQFHAFTSSKLNSEDVFNICILETLKWIRLRLKRFADIPKELIAPEPENYKELTEDMLFSFSLNIGANIDCTYMKNTGIWSFSIFEQDTGENRGTPQERLPISGRGFRIEISFFRHNENVEAGIRTTCSEPFDCEADCAVFRPTVVKALAENPNVGFVKEGFHINGKPLIIKSSSGMKKLERLFCSENFCMPIAFVADSGYEKHDIDISCDNRKLSFTGFSKFDFTGDIRADISKLDIEGISKENKDSNDEEKSKTPEKSELQNELPVKQPEKLPVFDYEYLASRTMGFAVVCFIEEKYLPSMKSKFDIDIKTGEIVVYSHHAETDRKEYNAENMKNLKTTLKDELKKMLKRSSFTFGNVLFYSDARIADFREKRHENISLEERLNIYRQENKELKKQRNELSQQNTDLRMSEKNTRMFEKQIKSLSAENEALKIYVKNITENHKEIEKAYRKSVGIIEFFRRKAAAAVYFPTAKEDVCDWIRKKFSDNIILAPKAESSMKKYNGSLDIGILCDGIYYLNAYADYRNGKISSEEFEMYSFDNNWEVEGCGKETLRVRRSDYTVNINGKQYLLDLHLKRGVSSQVLLRIYFCRDEKSGRIIIGYMPEHLPTASQTT
ncbi:MAG: hypothetical protein IKS03_06355 [Ruminococcus sp.]|nr:hypothetical protein [Ruminococcus sp.]